jgi:hypothetical protein
MWHECVLTAAYLINRTPSSVLNGKTPYDLVHGFPPNLEHLRNFGCLCFAVIPNMSDKFASRAQKCVFLGYSNSKKGYRLLNLDTKQCFVSRDVKFYENIFPYNMQDETRGDSVTGNLNTLNFFDFGLEQSNKVFDVSPDDDVSGRSQNISTTNDSAPDSLVNQNRSTSYPSLSSNDSLTREQDDANIISDRENSNQQIRDHPSEGSSENSNKFFVQRKSGRVSHLPKRFDEYVVEGKVKYGIECNTLGLSHIGRGQE